MENSTGGAWLPGWFAADPSFGARFTTTVLALKRKDLKKRGLNIEGRGEGDDLGGIDEGIWEKKSTRT